MRRPKLPPPPTPPHPEDVAYEHGICAGLKLAVEALIPSLRAIALVSVHGITDEKGRPRDYAPKGKRKRGRK